ncbi:MAG: ABC transporter substrate-binding protein, partial [bacterium]
IDRVEKILDGSLEIIEDVGATLSDRLYLKDEIDLIFSKDLGVNVLGFNCQKEPFSDVRVRKAIAMAFNKEKFVHTMLRGKGLVADGPLPLAFIGFYSDIGRMKFDPDAAKDLLAWAGYPEGLRVDLWRYDESERAGVLPLAIQKDLERIEVKVNIKYIDDWDTYNSGVMSGEASLFIDGWRGDPVDPDGFLYPFFHSRGRGEEGNLFHYSNKRLDRLLEEARRTMDEEMRKKLYDEAQRIIVADLPCLFISFGNEVFALRNSIKGFSVNPLGIVRLDQVEYVPF